jgi:transposase
MIEAKGFKLEYIPPYSPDYNPIEFSFSVLKRFLKKENYIHGDEDDAEFATKIIRATSGIITPTIARNQFRHCHIRVPE